MENKMYIKIKVYFQNVYFNKKGNFIWGKLVKAKHS